ncbi:monovalent cation/H+ antiporter subunit A [Pontibaca methylaminivorans]|uniref:monovalent cation/H+ antiporter subunit A n=1 Tax=Pontibaca methylaminivorans TaxID=515897 RepID=UPI002FD97666
MSVFLIAVLPFLGAVFPALMIRAGRNAAAMAAGAVTLAALAGLIGHLPEVMAGHVVTTRIDWMPGLGLNANFRLDGLGLLFAGLILGIGLLIIIYARFYLSERDPMGRFYVYLLLFQGAMTGIVLSDNVLLLLVFWELTSLSSFLLIGYWRHLPEGRQGARMSLAVTAGGGLAMLGGLLILGDIAGSYDLSVILTQREAIQGSPLYLPALILILLGCFTKSAQFPFHFWLPHAMAAPTPVSAYLHSATMVKAGLFLMARLWPVMAGTDAWFYIVATTGLVTMVVGAVIALFKDDLKSLLAFSTVSHLGLITMLLGFGSPLAAVAAVFHIINHATFKAALFMTAGIIDHAAHTRDIRRLGGLAGLMPVTFTLVAIAGLSMAGIPPFNGFISKEMMLEEVTQTQWIAGPWLLAAIVTAGTVFSVAYSLRYVAHVFLGRRRHDYPVWPRDPTFGMWLPPAVLVAFVVAIGLFPAAIAGDLVAVAAGAVTQTVLPAYSLSLWHGISPALLLSVVAIAGGVGLLLFYAPANEAWLGLRRPEAKEIYDRCMAGFQCLCRWITQRFDDGALSRYNAILIGFSLLIGVWAWNTGGVGPQTRESLAPTFITVIGWVALMGSAVGVAVFHRNRLLMLVMMGVSGLMVALTFNYFSAPDLALTQISVEVVSVVLLLLALNFMPPDTPRESTPARRSRDIVLSLGAGLGMAGLIYAILTRDFVEPSISGYHLAHSATGGGGTNVVNVTLVDFRGFDTFGEITVLGIAAVIIFAITETILQSSARERLLARQPSRALAGDRYPLIMVAITRILLPLVLMVAVYIFLRGHNQPGGGFVAGLLGASAIVIQYMASGFGWVATRQRMPYHVLIGAGVMIAALTGIGAWFNDMPFLTSAFTELHPPGFEGIELATAALFDLGVFLTVLGAVLLALESLACFAWQPHLPGARTQTAAAPATEPAARAGGGGD